MLLTYQRSMLMAAIAVAGSLAGVLLFDGPAIAQPEWKEVPLKDGTYRHTRALTAPTRWTFRCVRTAARSSTWCR